jgi:predicted double-glycine peptidase
MLVPFNALSKSSKIWIYQADRELLDEEVKKIKNKIESFLKNWQSHGKDLVASYKIAYNQFIILAVDEDKTKSSGCSVDASVALIKELEQDLQVNFFDRMKVTFKNNENINTINLVDFQHYASKGKINNKTVVFNNLVKNISEFETNWEIPAKNSWHSKFL